MVRINLPGQDGAGPTRAATMTDLVADRIRRGVKDGTIEAGSRLRQAEVARDLGFSVTPVREAFALLRQEGILVGDAHRGVVVFEPTVADLTEIYEVRASLEGIAARRSVLVISAEELESLRKILRQMSETHPKDVETHFALNAAFHAQLYASGASDRLRGMIDTLRQSAAIYRRFLGPDETSAGHGHAEHAQILAAYEAKDPDAAEAAIHDHFATRLTELTSLMEESSAHGVDQDQDA